MSVPVSPSVPPPIGVSRWRRIWSRARLSTFVTTATLLSGCFAAPGASLPPAALMTAVPTTAPAETAAWETVAPGLERRLYRPGPDHALTAFMAVRIDPALWSLRAHYRPGEPLFLSGWTGLLPEAAVIVNANYFDPERRALGLVVSDGAVFGQSFIGMGGMLEDGPNGIRVRSLAHEPYQGEALMQAVQAFPMLVLDGTAAYAGGRGDRISRRTIAGQDRAGRIVFLVSASLIGMTLADLSAWLPATDLDLWTAFNLDGGGSSLLGVQAANPTTIPSFDAVPVVVAAYPR